MEIQVNGVRLYCRKSGQGPPLVLLHGNGEDHHIFDPLAARLEAHFTLYAVDSRHHGQSESTGGYSYDSMAEDIRGLVEALGLGRAHLLGFSDGAIIGLLLAIRYPHLVDRLALLGVNLRPSDLTEEYFRHMRGVLEETGDPLYRLMLEEPDISLDQVRGVRNPVLLVAGEDDLFRPELYPELEQALPCCRFLLMKGHTHDSYIAGQDLLAEDLLHFFAAT